MAAATPPPLQLLDALSQLLYVVVAVAPGRGVFVYSYAVDLGFK